MKLINLKCNSCDGRYNSLDVHFTGFCDNKCPFCIDACNQNKKKSYPDAEKIANTIIKEQEKYEDVLFLGGEPCLYIKELLKCVKKIKKESQLKVFVTTSVPYTCYLYQEDFFELLNTIDGLNISAQHYDEEIADKIRQSHSKFDRQEFYKILPHKDKIRLTVNLIKPYFDSKEEIIKLIHHYDKFGFNQILLRELQNCPDMYVSFEKTMNMKLPSAYAHGCQTEIKISGEKINTPIILKRSCRLVEQSIEATSEDVLKLLIKSIKKPSKHSFGVVWEDGSLTKGW